MKIRSIEWNITKEFLDKFHIHGSEKQTTYNFGAFDKEKLVGVMTFRKEKKKWKFVKYVSDFETHAGMASKLFNHFIKEYEPNIVTACSDNRYFLGNLYKNLGFVFSNVTGPRKWYLHDFKTRNQNSITNDVIWDCGSTEWIWTQ